MNRSILMLALVAALGLSACERQPTVVTVPAPVAEPGPAGPQGEPGVQGNTGYTGQSGAQGDTGTGETGETGRPDGRNRQDRHRNHGDRRAAACAEDELSMPRASKRLAHDL